MPNDPDPETPMPSTDRTSVTMSAGQWRLIAREARLRMDDGVGYVDVEGRPGAVAEDRAWRAGLESLASWAERQAATADTGQMNRPPVCPMDIIGQAIDLYQENRERHGLDHGQAKAQTLTTYTEAMDPLPGEIGATQGNNPADDPVGTVRMDPDGDVWVLMSKPRWPYPWFRVGSDGISMGHDVMAGSEVIGAVPGTPASEPAPDRPADWQIADAIEMVKICLGHPDAGNASHFSMIQQARRGAEQERASRQDWAAEADRLEMEGKAKDAEIRRLRAEVDALRHPGNPAPDKGWRVGRHVPRNLYKDGRDVGRMDSAEDAAAICAAMNAAKEINDDD